MRPERNSPHHGEWMGLFPPEVLDAAKREREVTLTTYGRKTGEPHDVTIWIATDGERLYIRSGQGLTRQWPQNLLARGGGLLRLGKLAVAVKPRLVTDPAEARATSGLYKRKYGPFVKPSKPSQPLTPGEQATFELLPAEPSTPPGRR
jgi:deazaflavin-dependent oxidoreductase (nitroreductase family)